MLTYEYRATLGIYLWLGYNLSVDQDQTVQHLFRSFFLLCGPSRSGKLDHDVSLSIRSPLYSRAPFNWEKREIKFLPFVIIHFILSEFWVI